MMKKISWFVIPIWLVLCAACGVPLSKNPLSSPEKSTIDADLYGPWELVAEGDLAEVRGFLHLGQDEKLVHFHFISHEAEGRIGFVNSRAFTTRIGDIKYLNLKIDAFGPIQEEVIKKMAQGKYTFAQYELVSPDQLRLSVIDGETVKRDIQADKIEGKVEYHMRNMEVSLVASSKKLAKYIHENRERLFKRQLLFNRMQE